MCKNNIKIKYFRSYSCIQVSGISKMVAKLASREKQGNSENCGISLRDNLYPYLFSTMSHICPIQGNIQSWIHFLCTVAPPLPWMISANFSIIFEKLWKLQICHTRRLKGLSTALLLILLHKIHAGIAKKLHV